MLSNQVCPESLPASLPPDSCLPLCSINLNTPKVPDWIPEILECILDLERKNRLKAYITSKELEVSKLQLACHTIQNDFDLMKKRYNKLVSSDVQTSEFPLTTGENNVLRTTACQYDKQSAQHTSSHSDVSIANKFKSEHCYTHDNKFSTSDTSTDVVRPIEKLATQAFYNVEKIAKHIGLKILTNNLLSAYNRNDKLPQLDAETLQMLIKPWKFELTLLPNSYSPVINNASQCISWTESSALHKSDYVQDPLLVNPPKQILPCSDRLCDPSKSAAFTMCNSIAAGHNKLYEQQFAKLSHELSVKSDALRMSIKREEDLEDQLQHQVLEQNNRIEKLDTAVNELTDRLNKLLSLYQTYKDLTEKELRALQNERQLSHSNLESIRDHYDALLGRRSKAAAELSDQPIQLPNDKTDLELLALKLYEENISFREAREHLDDRLRNESQLHRQQLLAEQQERATLESSLRHELQETRSRLAGLVDIVAERDNEMNARRKFEDEAKRYKAELSDLQSKYESAEISVTESQSHIMSLQDQVARLQTDLDNVESVQADFVHLSQNLQVQLEKLRQQEHEVRWVHPDDVTTCFACNAPFQTSAVGGTKSRKVNCRHCGKVHCLSCLKNTMPAGPYGRPVSVCDICHTLLNKHVAPYFSTNPAITGGNCAISKNSDNAHSKSVDLTNSPKRSTLSYKFTHSPPTTS